MDRYQDREHPQSEPSFSSPGMPPASTTAIVPCHQLTVHCFLLLHLHVSC